MKWLAYTWFALIAVAVLPLPFAVISYIYTGSPLFSDSQLATSMLAGVVGTFFTLMAVMVFDV